MAFSRRGFIGLLAKGAIATCVVAKVSTDWIPVKARTYAACDYLREAFNAHCRKFGRTPDRMHAGRQLYESFETEITALMRFTVSQSTVPREKSLMFKDCALYQRGEGWHVQCLGREEAA